MTTIKRSLITMLLVISILVMLPTNGSCAKMELNEMIEEQREKISDYVIDLVQANGAIPMYAPSVSDFNPQGLETIDGVAPEVYLSWPSGKIVPYFSQNAILGLMQATPEKAKESTERFIDWYIGHLNDKDSDINGVDGTVYDYYCFIDPADPSHIIELTVRKLYENEYVDKPTENPNDYDSTDSYAARFLRVLNEYYENYGDDFLKDKKSYVQRIINAMLSTYVPSLGLTGAKPNYMVCYLMDNCEVYDGLIAASELMKNVYNEDAYSEELLGKAKIVKDAIEKHLWSEKDGAYFPYVFEDGVKPSKPSLDVFYPDATCQLFTIAYGILDPKSERAQVLYDDFNKNFGTGTRSWQLLNTGDAFPWTILSVVAAQMEDYERLETFVGMIRGRFMSTKYRYPFYNSEAGSFLRMVTILTNSEYYKTNYPESGPTDESIADESTSVETSIPTEVSSPQENVDKNDFWKFLAIGGVAAVAAVGTVVAIMKKKKK